MDAEAPPPSAADPYAHLQLVANPDGSYTRLFSPPTVPTTAASDTTSPVLTKDVIVNEDNNTWFRIFLPRVVSPDRKLPIIVYFHGGGFILLSPATDFCHDFCARMAASTPAVVVSVRYRLAPEHRLPTAYHDAVEAVYKLRECIADEWLASNADFAKIYLAGTSAGGNIAYRVGLQLSTAAVNGQLEPLKVKGLILHHPFFGGVVRTPSEERLVNDQILPLCMTDLMWKLSLPSGADRDHQYCNPTSGNADDLAKLECFKKMGWEVLVMASDGDPLYDGQLALEALLAGSGVRVSRALSSGDGHGIELFDPVKAEVLLGEIKLFVGQ
uniref:Alpha/beta hydrolase fold-3 domain-containing protein n=1 Tax=Kalanchoe fedtschenkoi TaxID=63787 RepID=A0A7N0UZD4_KALFE